MTSHEKITRVLERNPKITRVNCIQKHLDLICAKADETREEVNRVCIKIVQGEVA